MTRKRSRGIRVALIGTLSALALRSAAAQQDTTRPATVAAGAGRPLSLEEALRTAESQSATLQLARARLTSAEGQRYQARSQYLPQLTGVASYQRTLRSQFQGVSFGGPPDTSTTPKPQAVCAPTIAPNATPSR